MPPIPIVVGIGDMTFHVDLAISFNLQQDILKLILTPYPKGVGPIHEFSLQI